MRLQRSPRFVLGLAFVACTSAGNDGVPSASGECQFTIRATLSSRIATVGIVEWSTTFEGLESASVEFGLDTGYGSSAPVDLAEPEYRTVLLGMKASRTYHYRIIARRGEGECVSTDQTLETGPVDNRIYPITQTVLVPDARTNGFFLSGFLTTGPAFILDADGDYVWWYGEGEMGRVALSRDRKFVWFAGINVAGKNPSMKRVSVDGLVEDDFSAEFGQIHHDFTVLPDETIAFLEHDGLLDRVMERSPDGSVHEVVSLSAALGGVDRNHGNSLHYSEPEDVYTVSDLFQNAFVKVRRTGEVVWILGGANSSFSGDVGWYHQHGHQLLDPNHLLFFANGDAGEASRAIELELDLSMLIATRTWQYETGVHSLLYGDVQRLENGNTLVTFSPSGLVHEVAPEGTLVNELRWGLGGAVGYASLVPSLYATPR
jgi:hypothetical protein